MAIFSIRKWRKNSKGTGAIVEMSYYDEASEKWLNVKANVPFAENYAGKNEDERPAALCGIGKDGETLTIKVYRFDDYVPEKKDTGSDKNSKKGGTGASKKKNVEKDDDCPF